MTFLDDTQRLSVLENRVNSLGLHAAAVSRRLSSLEEAMMKYTVLAADTRARIRRLEDQVMPGEEGTLSRCRHFMVDVDDDDTATCMVCGATVSE